MLEYPLLLYIAAGCAPLQRGMRGPLIHPLVTQLEEKKPAKFTSTRFFLHSVNFPGCSLLLKSVAHFCLKRANLNKVTIEVNPWGKMDPKKMLENQC